MKLISSTTLCLTSIVLMACSITQSTKHNIDDNPILKNGSTLTVTSYNIHHGENIYNDPKLKFMQMFVGKASSDLFGFQEVDKETLRSANIDQSTKLFSNLTGYKTFFHKTKDYNNGEYGNSIGYSNKLKILSTPFGLPLQIKSSEPRSAIFLPFSFSGLKFVFVNTHLPLYDDGHKGFKKVIENLENHFSSHIPIIVGDFNHRWEYLPHNLIKEKNLQINPHHADFSTYAVAKTINPFIQLDYILVGIHERVSVKYRVQKSIIASDHCPITAAIFVLDK